MCYKIFAESCKIHTMHSETIGASFHDVCHGLQNRASGRNKGQVK